MLDLARVLKFRQDASSLPGVVHVVLPLDLRSDPTTAAAA
jgi:hypothetical protein